MTRKNAMEIRRRPIKICLVKMIWKNNWLGWISNLWIYAKSMMINLLLKEWKDQYLKNLADGMQVFETDRSALNEAERLTLQ